MIPISFMGILGSMVSKKYEVDEAYHYPPVSGEERIENLILDQRNFELNMYIAGYLILGTGALTGIVMLFWKRGKKVMQE